ncbi:7-carboxy-7-deazaguanine synthase [Lactococcus hodotermopsidis]|uniref:7-carboxy-7-deazaguanine synthase n=1 Tax=Pseudolactococcus hodotermopsidis TaxID=2709157 RepID=A0A6A0BBE3_9LACT|nr:7-carboxy-7-deazaguanine synthase QueE [Lactococcus hodotermopsidis]GFH41704.1 7-carboxy-7-deazaguanine synthase [Lactococcus hodotermopsidis]
MKNNQGNFPIVEIFESIQGEGANTGRPAIFIRLGKCNLACPWCDTDFNTFETWTLAQIMIEIAPFQAKNIIITGGEPTVHQNLAFLVSELKNANYQVWLETNGLLDVPRQVDYVATSPKRLYRKMYEKHSISKANEVRIVIDDSETSFEFCQFIEQKIAAEHYFVSPCEVDGVINWEETVRVLGQLNNRQNRLNNWFLSIQTHKIMAIR